MLKRAYIEITNVCNLRCSFCPGTGRKKEFMTPERFRLLAEKLRGESELIDENAITRVEYQSRLVVGRTTGKAQKDS